VLRKRGRQEKEKEQKNNGGVKGDENLVFRCKGGGKRL